MQGYALLVLCLDTMEWASLAYGVDRDKCEQLAERVREVLAVPCRVIECEIYDDGYISPFDAFSPFRATDLFPDDSDLEPPGH